MTSRTYRLREIAPPIPAVTKPVGEQVWLLNLDQIEPHTGTLLSKEYVQRSRLGTSTQPFDSGNVLYSKLRPYLNKVLIPDSAGYCTSELVPLRPNQELVTREYLAAYLRSVSFLNWVSQQVDGAKMPRVSMKVLWEHSIELPTLEQQRRITSILDKADRLRRLRQQAIRLADELLRAAYIEIFGDPITNPYQWPILELWEVIDSTKLGLVRSSEEFGWDLPTPYLRMDAITKDGKILHNKIQGTRATKVEVAEFGLKRGDLLFNTRNSRELVGKTALWDSHDGAVFNNNVMRIRFNELIAPEVVDMQFRLPALMRELESRKSGTTSVFAIYFKDLKTLPIQVPSEAAQAKFVQIAKRTRAYILKVDSMIKTSKALSLALSNKLLNEL